MPWLKPSQVIIGLFKTFGGSYFCAKPMIQDQYNIISHRCLLGLPHIDSDSVSGLPTPYVELVLTSIDNLQMYNVSVLMFTQVIETIHIAKTKQKKKKNVSCRSWAADS